MSTNADKEIAEEETDPATQIATAAAKATATSNPSTSLGGGLVGDSSFYSWLKDNIENMSDQEEGQNQPVRRDGVSRIEEEGEDEFDDDLSSGISYTLGGDDDSITHESFTHDDTTSHNSETSRSAASFTRKQTHGDDDDDDNQSSCPEIRTPIFSRHSFGRASATGLMHADDESSEDDTFDIAAAITTGAIEAGMDDYADGVETTSSKRNLLLDQSLKKNISTDGKVNFAGLTETIKLTSASSSNKGIKKPALRSVKSAPIKTSSGGNYSMISPMDPTSYSDRLHVPSTRRLAGLITTSKSVGSAESSQSSGQRRFRRGGGANSARNAAAAVTTRRVFLKRSAEEHPPASAAVIVGGGITSMRTTGDNPVLLSRQQQQILAATNAKFRTHKSSNQPQHHHPHQHHHHQHPQHGTNPMSTGAASANANSPGGRDSRGGRRSTFLADRLARRSEALKSRVLHSQQVAATNQRLRDNAKGKTTNLEGETNKGGDQSTLGAGSGNQRRYKTGDYVLVSNHQSHWATLVNRYGFPTGEGETLEEQRGPYIYVLATVKQIHYEEIAAYYTVTRCDTGADQRADAGFMEPLRTTRGELAALRAATESQTDAGGDDHIGRTYYNFDTGGNGMNGRVYYDENGQLQQGRRGVGDGSAAGYLTCLLDCCGYFWGPCLGYMQYGCYMVMLPFLCIYDTVYFTVATYISPMWQYMEVAVKRQARLLLNGKDPYVCRLRWTTVNFIVVCSTWFMFIDQARLVFFSPSADYALAVINFGVWIVLVLELVCEVFIRPEGYRSLIVSDKAYAPTTVRFINSFHLCVETISLLFFVPEFMCIVLNDNCGTMYPFSFNNAALMATIGPTRLNVFYGRAYLALIRLRVFGLVRHWKNMWINITFISMRWKRHGGMVSSLVPITRSSRSSADRRSLHAFKKKQGHRNQSDLDQANKNRLTNASNIGTALMVTNSYRSLATLWIIAGIFPVVFSLVSTNMNLQARELTSQLQATNLVASDTSNDTCAYLRQSTWSWLIGVTAPYGTDSNTPFLLSAELTPARCLGTSQRAISQRDMAQRSCSFSHGGETNFQCSTWRKDYAPTHQSIADALGLRAASVVFYEKWDIGNLTDFAEDGSSTTTETTYKVEASFDMTATIRLAALSSLILQFSLLVAVLGGLSVLRRDAEVLVLDPLRRMLRIVARYAKNPLVQPKVRRRSALKRNQSAIKLNSGGYVNDDSDLTYSDDESVVDGYQQEFEVELGNYETNKLITAVAKITDLLRKCWGVAGADIISTNLAIREGALTEVFNPTVPGKSVYALFGFAAISGFDHALRNIGGDVMRLINDVASVLHGEVFRWGFVNSGQCNKNLGSAFLMVFRIGLVKEVIEKLEQATDVIFSTGTAKAAALSIRKRVKHSSSTSSSTMSIGSSNSRNPVMRSISSAGRRRASRPSVKAMSLSLESLPGISTFTDRAVIGMLKSFAGIHRDQMVLNWSNDFRLGAGVGAFSVSMIYGMDAGWAVEGAVGSEHKIDATYLSPHVNMASRMMSACKQYGVSIMLSQAVQQLMSDYACDKLRHLDTVTVKGSILKQKIFTYDARARGVDFFLYGRSDEQADIDADRYTPNIWNTDQDLKAMRQHITDDFLKEFREGHKAYLNGDWKRAIKKLERANEIMFETALEEGYLEDEFDALQHRIGEDAKRAAEELKRDNGDGPSMFLLNFMHQHGGIAPAKWDGWHPLTSK